MGKIFEPLNGLISTEDKKQSHLLFNQFNMGEMSRKRGDYGGKFKRIKGEDKEGEWRGGGREGNSSDY